MRRYPIEVVKKTIRRRDPEEAAEISRQNFLRILALARSTWVWEEVEPLVEMTCDSCGSFVLDFLKLTLAMDELLGYLSDPDSRAPFSGRLKAALEALYEDLGFVDYDEFEEIAVILDVNCSCYPYLVGEPPEKKAERSPFERGPRDSVKTYIGPRLKW